MKKKIRIAIGISFILIGVCMISLYCFLIKKNSKVKEKAKNFIEENVKDEDEDTLYVDDDFLEKLQELFKNKDIIGFIQYENADIAYPVVKSEDNVDYLRADLNKNYSPFGTIFVDKRCEADFSSVNTIIYGHHMRDGSMFGKLEEYINKNGIEGESFYIYTRDSRLEYKLVSSEIIVDNKENFNKMVSDDKDELLEWIKPISTRYIYDKEKDKGENFVTLISCHYSIGRVDRFGLTGILVESKSYKEEQ